MSSGLHFSNYSTWRITVGWRMDCRGQDGRRAAAGFISLVQIRDDVDVLSRVVAYY